MNLDLSSDGELQVNKVLFDLKGVHNDGLMLQLHQSFMDGQSDRKKCRFLHSSFSENNLIAVLDTNGSIYIIDLEMQKYWKMPYKGNISAISFPPLIKSNLLVALCSGVLQMVHFEKGIVTGVLVGHSTPVREISYSYDKNYCLTSNSTEAIIWNLLSYSQAHKLSLREDVLLKKALFMPVQDSIFACFRDDAMHIWKFGTFECFKQIIPEDWKTYNLKTVAFTKNGRAMVVGGCTQNIAVFCLDTWTIGKVIELPDNVNGVKHMEFLPQPFDGGANKILGIVTTSLELCFLDIDSLLFLNNTSSCYRLVETFHVSPNGKYLAMILESGEIDIYITEQLLLSEKNIPTYLQCIWSGTKSSLETMAIGIDGGTSKKSKQKWVEELKTVHNELKEELTLKRLVPILKQFGEYPESYRIIIWRTILQLPMNQEAYVSLANKECHPSYVNIETKYPLVNKALSNTLKRVLSSLAYWCPLFGEVSFLPEFVFPFIKLLHFDPFVCFESVATIIVNWCQNWFEFYPFPPVNVLTIIENVLGYHDSDLLEFFYEKNVTACSYACSLMQTAFSEVLTKNEWLRLWDHILSNEPSFIFMVVVAYNIICRNGIKNCDSNKEIEEIFHNQNVIDLKLLLTKSYYFMDKTPPDIHPRRYFSPFSPLQKGDTYMLYEAYPKLILDRNAAKLHLIKKQEQEIIQEQQKAIAIKRELDRKLKTDHEADFKEDILTELDEKFRQIVNAEEERISAQRKKLQNLRHELKLKELAVLEEVREQIIRKRREKKEMEIERLMEDISVRKAREKSQLESVEDEIRNYYSNLLLHKFRLQLDLDSKDQDHPNDAPRDLEYKKAKLTEELGELQDDVIHAYYNKKIELTNKISRITDMLQKIETEMVHDLVRKDEGESSHRKNKIEIEKLWKEAETFEKKLESLLHREPVPTLEITESFQRGIRCEEKDAGPEKVERCFGKYVEAGRDRGICGFSRKQMFINEECNPKNETLYSRRTSKRDQFYETHQLGRTSDCSELESEENGREKLYFETRSPSKFNGYFAAQSSPLTTEIEESSLGSKTGSVGGIGGSLDSGPVCP